MNKKQKILILVEWFAPGFKAGGPIQSCVNMCIALKDTYDIYVLTTNTDHGETIPYKDVITNKWILHKSTGVMVFYGEKNNFSFSQMAQEIKSIDADFNYLNLFFSPQFVLFPLWLKFINKIKGAVIICPRGTLYDSALSLKAYKKKPLLLLLKWLKINTKILFHATNKREATAITTYFPKSKIVIADNLPNTFQKEFISSTKNMGELKCIFIARIVPIKNLLFLLNLISGLKQHVLLTIVGPVEDDNYWLECKRAIDQLPSTIKINFLGPVPNDQLNTLIQQHHLFILPTTGENFGHAIFESLLAGRPVLISDQTPWLDLDACGAGWVLPLNKPNLFVSALNKVANFNQTEFDQYASGAWKYAHKFITNPEILNPYLQLFNKTAA